MEEQRQLGPFVLRKVNRLPMRIRVMHSVYGLTEGQTCGTCAHCYKKQFSGTYYKCDLTKQTNGPATDWRIGWQACGKWEPRGEVMA
jgi:hypothetical protein